MNYELKYELNYKLKYELTELVILLPNPSGTLDDPASPIYHLHYRILELTNGEMRLIRCERA